ncbi:7-cyano-7-deazaguanine synthase [Thermococcus paralvinellae]|uniref:TilS-like tRNA(Ile)-lysidine synthetase n=1 Tax=Thermococcus paralvinellae TaxID=582419 RepID=W0I4V0_9EURY|nr:7-cyano-7-deazaguanine synthase [Thermococcus paralvinellae]AHF79777.1 TilS-like tRNA(Ile)-lysidine synthetase [Thermococcus paralvinellae]
MLSEIIKEIKQFAKNTGLYEKKILLMFSGGKDSSLALYIMKKAGLDVSALTFFHRWSWREPMLWAMDFTKKLGVEHYLVDITEGLLKNSIGKKGPICIHCKKVMMRNAYWFAKINGFEVLAKGDNANDKIIGALLDQWNGDIRLSEIPRIGIPIFRPLIRYTAEEVEKLAEEAGIKPYRMYEYGRRRQWREGCPLQYIDRFEIIKPEYFDLAYEVNYKISKLARKYKVRMSVRVPSLDLMCHGCNEKILKEAEEIIRRFKNVATRKNKK